MNNITVSWPTPVTRSDGSPLPIEEIKHFRIYASVNGGGYSSMMTAPRTANQVVIPNPALGTHRFRVSTVDQQDQESSLSPASPEVVIVAAVPNPPDSVNAVVN